VKFFSLIRLLLLISWSGFANSLALVDEVDLNNFEYSRYSQNGEDGIIEKILSLIGTSSKYFVEFGAADGFANSNTLNLSKAGGWTGLLLDSEYENVSINLHKAFVTKENVNQIFAQYHVPHDLDLLSIDIDFNDFHVWQALSDEYRPRLVVIEYNATHLPDEDKVVNYHPTAHGDGTNYFGASIKAFYNLGKKKGYSLVYADKQGVNLFFVRNDLLEYRPFFFKNINDVHKIYRKPNYGQGPNGGHVRDYQERLYVSSEELLKKP
jgi:hypothetical protein